MNLLYIVAIFFSEILGNPIPSSEPWPRMWQTGGGIVVPCTYEIFCNDDSAPFIYEILFAAMVHVPRGIVQLH